MQVVVIVWQTQVFLEFSGDFFGNMFDLQLVKSRDAEPVDMEGQWLYILINT